MELLPPALRGRLGRARIRRIGAEASGGVGARRSRGTGPGIEFHDHRPYQAGDDLRFVDRHIYARLGQYHVREFETYRELAITIVLDASESMAYGSPSKLHFGAGVAAGLAYVGLAHGDRVLVGATHRDGVRWFRRQRGARQAEHLVDWLETLRPTGASALHQALAHVVQRTREPGLTIVVSDLWSDGLAAAVGDLARRGQEIVVVHVLSPEEVDPLRLGAGAVRLVDSETGEDVETLLEPHVVVRYHEALDAWCARVRETVRSLGGRYYLATTDTPIERLLLHDWRIGGLIE